MSNEDEERRKRAGVIPLPAGLPKELETQYREFAAALLIQQLLARNGFGNAQGQKVLFYAATAVAQQLRDPDAVIAVGQGLLEQYKDWTERHANELLADPVLALRWSVANPMARRLAVAAERNKPVTVTLTPEHFGFSLTPTPPAGREA